MTSTHTTSLAAANLSWTAWAIDQASTYATATDKVARLDNLLEIARVARGTELGDKAERAARALGRSL